MNTVHIGSSNITFVYHLGVPRPLTLGDNLAPIGKYYPCFQITFIISYADDEIIGPVTGALSAVRDFESK